MAMLQKQLQLLNAYAPTATGTNADGTFIDATASSDLGMGNPLEWLVQITTTVTGNANATLQIALQGSADNSAWTTVATVLPAAITQANFATQAVAGQTPFSIRIPRGYTFRYWRAVIIISTATLTAGAFSSWILNDAIQDNKNYPAGYTVK